MGQQAAPVAFEPQSRRLIRGYLAHLRSRAEVRERKRDADLERYVPGTFAAIPDGTLVMAREGATWSLWLWNDEYGRRQLASGTWEQVQRCALEVAIHGPPGGPDLCGQGSSWRDIGGDGTLHWLTLGGDFRLMPLFGDGHILAFSRNDGPLRVLDIGDAEALQDAPGEHPCNDVLHVSIGGDRAELRGVCAAGVLGVLEMHGGSRLLLGHLEGESFGLFFVRGREVRCLGLYDFDTVCRGDLGEVFAGAGLGEPGGLDDVVGDARWSAQAQPARRPAPLRPRLAPHQSTAVQPGPRTQVVAPQPRQPKPAPRRAGLSPEDRRCIDDHLTVTEPKPATGPGASQVPKMFKCFRALAARGGPTQLLRNCDLRSLFEDELEVEFFCCTKTFGRAVASVAGHTSILEPVGKRWLLLGGDRLIEKLNASEDEPEASSTAAGPAPPAMDPQPVAEPPASSTTHPEPSVSSTPHPESLARSTTPRHPEPPTGSTAPCHPEPPAGSTAPRHPEPPAGSTAPLEPAPAADSAGPLVSPERELEQLLIQQWIDGKKSYSYQPPAIMRAFSLASVPDGVSASRHPGKKPRDGPS
ncbi:MAG: hypothetical protein IPG88_27145 [Gemmatimonadetes bacterium]|nr:hypothetical protein [Gemmatimonadota bacterium]